MKLSINVIGQALLTLLHAGNVASGLVPSHEQFFVAAALGVVQIAVSVLAHFCNPDGSPASVPNGLSDEQMAQYRRIFGGAK
jgi:hypothetical protein